MADGRNCAVTGHFAKVGVPEQVIPIVTQKSLTATLRRLERNGMVDRVITSSRPVAVEYRITPLGKTFQEPIDALLHWTTANIASVQHARARFDNDAQPGRALP